MDHIKYPYNVNALTQEYAMKYLEDPGQKEMWVREIVSQRQRLEKELRNFGFVRRIYPSDANFLLVKVDEPLSSLCLSPGWQGHRPRQVKSLPVRRVSPDLGGHAGRKCLTDPVVNVIFCKPGKNGVTAPKQSAMKKALFIDRDGTLIAEPPVDYQVDSLEKLEFIPGVFRNLYRIRHFLDYELVIVSNQDGMGTENYPYENFIGPHRKFLRAFENEDVIFDDILIDTSMPADNAPTRKPRTGLLDEIHGWQL